MFQTTNQLRMVYYCFSYINQLFPSIVSVESLGNGNLNENISFEIQDCNYYSRNGRFHGKIGFQRKKIKSLSVIFHLPGRSVQVKAFQGQPPMGTSSGNNLFFEVPELNLSIHYGDFTCSPSIQKNIIRKFKLDVYYGGSTRLSGDRFSRCKKMIPTSIFRELLSRHCTPAVEEQSGMPRSVLKMF